MEESTIENEELVSSVYERVLEAVNSEEKVTSEENFVFQIELLSQEVNSGASFEQYFRWVGKEEVDQIPLHVKSLNIEPLYRIVTDAIQVAFPNGVPSDEGEYEECTEWSEEQEEKLEELCVEFEEYNGAITNLLGEFIKKHNLCK